MDAARCDHQSLGVGLESMPLVDVLNHQLRTPLSALVGHLELLQDSDLDLPGHAERSFEVIAGAVERLVDVADWISRVVDRQTGGAEVVRSPDPGQVVRPLLTSGHLSSSR